MDLETACKNYEEEYHRNVEELHQLKTQVQNMIENLFIDGFTTNTKKMMVEILKKCR